MAEGVTAHLRLTFGVQDRWGRWGRIFKPFQYPPRRGAYVPPKVSGVAPSFPCEGRGFGTGLIFDKLVFFCV